MHWAPSPGLPPSPSSSERKVGLGLSHGLTAVTGSVSLNYRDTMCINRMIASGLHPLRQTVRGTTRPEPILKYLGFVGSHPDLKAPCMQPTGWASGLGVGGHSRA